MIKTKQSGIKTATQSKFLNYVTNSEVASSLRQRAENEGGFFGGVGYLFEKLAVGFMTSVEGIWDYAAGGIADLFGADKWAESQMENDWFGDWYSHPEEWYNPSSGWQTAGDVAGGIGTSAPSMLAVAGAGAIAYFSGGSLSPVAAGLISAAVAGLGAAGNATKEAYKETGKLGAEEYGYGAMVGVTEGAIEGVTSVIGAGSGKIVKSIANSFGKQAAKSVGKTTAKSVVLDLGKAFISEAFGEGFATWIDPYYKRATYDPDAENATAQEILYTATVGGIAGMIMDGGAKVTNTGISYLKGRNIANKGNAKEVMKLSEYLSAFENQNKTEDETYTYIAETYAKLAKSLASTGGEIKTAGQKKLLGDLQRANTVAVFKPMVYKSAANIVSNAEIVAERINSYYKDANGNPLNVTAADIVKGIDKSSPQAMSKSFQKALQENGILRTLAVADTTGHLFLDAERFEQRMMQSNIASQADLNRFIETASEEKKASLGEALGIENWDAIELEEFNEKFQAFVSNGDIETFKAKNALIEEFKSLQSKEPKRGIPKNIHSLKDGETRTFNDGYSHIAIKRAGDGFTIYDYGTGNISHELSLKDANKALRTYAFKRDETVAHNDKVDAERNKITEVNKYATENIKGYSALSDANKGEIRRLIRQGRAKGVSDADIITYARVSTRAGIKIKFSKESCLVIDADGKPVLNDDGTIKYGDGAYNYRTQEIIVNPEGKRTAEKLLSHELLHNMFAYMGGVKPYRQLMKAAQKKMNSKKKSEIAKAYLESGVIKSEKDTILSEEITAHYTEEFANQEFFNAVLEEKQGFGKRILNFLKNAITDYEGDQRLTREAKEYQKVYKKLFDRFADRNYQSNSFESSAANGIIGNERFTIEKSTDNKPFVVVDEDILDGVAESDWINKVKSNLAAKFPNGVQVGRNVINIDNQSRKELTFSRYTTWLKNNDPQAFSDKLRVTNNADEVLEATDGWVNEGLNHPRKDSITSFARGNVLLRIGKNDYSATVIVGTFKNGKMILYDIINLTPTTITKKETASAIPVNSSQRTERKTLTISNDSITETEPNVNTNDKKSYALPKTDQEYLAAVEKGDIETAQKMVDEAAKKAGYTIKAYHGTKNDFTEFDKNKIGSGVTLFASQGKGFYFTARESVAEKYSRGGRVLSSYLKANNLFSFVDKKSKNVNSLLDEFARLNGGKFDINQYSDFVDFEKRTGSVLSQVVKDKGESFTAFLQGKGFDGILYTSYDYDTGSSNKTYVIFEPEQIKSADPVTYDNDGNVIPLSKRFDATKKDIRYALPNKDSQGNELTAEQQEFFKDSKIRDSEGNLLLVYHGTPKENGEFYVFDYNKAKRKGGFGFASFGKGFYFTTKKEAAEIYTRQGGRLLSVYVNIKHPYIVNGDIKEQISKDFGIDPLNVYLQEVRRILSSNGYDGIIQGEGDAITVVAYYPEQIKLTSNQNPTANPDIRYALAIGNESVEVEAEHTKNLVALHNLSEDNLLRVLELGGFPMPSIAITKTDLAHNNYGDITVVFGRETVDPENDSRNIVYDRDAWTPTIPKVDVKLSKQKVNDLIDELQENAGGVSSYKRSVDSFFDGRYRDNNGDYVISEYDYKKDLIGEKAIRNSGILAAYLKQKGIEIEPVYIESGFTMGWTSFTRKEAADLLEFVGISKDITRDNITTEQREKVLEKLIKYKAKEKLPIVRRFKNNANLTLEQVEDVLKSEYSDGHVSQLLFMAEDFFDEKRPKDVYDEHATIDKMRTAVGNEEDFYDWFWNKIESTLEKKGIDNDSDVFDRRGNRRSFEQRHFAYTAANIVKAMTKGEQEGKAGFGMSAGALAAKLSKRFESIEDIREAKEYLSLVSEEDLKAFNDKTYELYGELLTEIAGTSSDYFSNSSRREDVGDILGKCAAAKPLTVENIKRIFDKETRGYNLNYKFNNDIAEQALLLFESLKHIPTTYFEAKPRRVVNFKEIKMVLVPNKASSNLKNRLEKAKIPYRIYGETDAQRTEAIKKLDNVRFALPYTAPTTDAVTTEVEQAYKPTIKDKVFTGWTATQIAFTNAQAGIEKVGKILGVSDIESIVQAARSATNQADEMLAGNQRRIGDKSKVYQGEGLEKILRPVKEKGTEYTEVFFDYLFNYHNVNRMNFEAISIARNNGKVKLLAKNKKDITNLKKRKSALIKSRSTAKNASARKSIQTQIKDIDSQINAIEKVNKKLENDIASFVPAENKPVLDCTAKESATYIKEYEKNYPEFKGIARKLWNFIENLNQYRVDTGLISQDTMMYLKQIYPHYVPTYRTDTNQGIGAVVGKYNLEVKKAIKRAKGSTKDLLPIDVMLARQVEETIRAGRINVIANALYEGAQSSGKSTYIEVISKEKVSESEQANIDPMDLRPKNNQVTFFRDGEKITMRVSSEVFAGFDAFAPRVDISNPLLKIANKVNDTFKRLVTSLNPAFLLRNSARDIQDAGIYSKYPKSFLKNYARAAKYITEDHDLWQLYRSMGGLNSSVFDFDKGIVGAQNKWGLTKAEGNLLKKLLVNVENANAFVEQLPRFAEFISSIEAGNTTEQAILDSADVTTNFGRSGTLTKKLNSTLIPFLNPAIQGFSKLIRTITGARTAKEITALLLKIAVVGIIPHLINDLMYDDDEDYEQLRDTDKENNFLFKIGDKFIKIPKGRVASIFAGLVNRTKDMFEGESDAWDGYVDNVIQQVTPVSNFSRTIFSPFMDVSNNLTWYGSAIEGQQFENTAPKDRYDESTSSIAVWLGQLLNYSPKKIHYILDQYSGVIGDFILPATTQKAEKDFISGNFTLDPVSSNKLSTDFYNIYEEAQYAKTAGDDTAIYQVKYLNKVKSAVSELYKQKSEIQKSDLTDEEKLVQTNAIQILINEAFKTAVSDYKSWTDTVQKTQGVGADLSSSERVTLRYTESLRIMYGSERALREYDAKVYENCQLLSKANISYDDLYYFYFSTRNITSDKDKQGNTIAGSKRNKIMSAVNQLKLPTEQKLILIASKGYALTEDEKNTVARYIVKLKKLSKDDKIALAEMCGLEVKGGKIVAKKPVKPLKLRLN